MFTVGEMISDACELRVLAVLQHACRQGLDDLTTTKEQDESCLLQINRDLTAWSEGPRNDGCEDLQAADGCIPRDGLDVHCWQFDQDAQNGGGTEGTAPGEPEPKFCCGARWKCRCTRTHDLQTERLAVEWRLGYKRWASQNHYPSYSYCTFRQRKSGACRRIMMRCMERCKAAVAELRPD